MFVGRLVLNSFMMNNTEIFVFYKDESNVIHLAGPWFPCAAWKPLLACVAAPKKMG